MPAPRRTAPTRATNQTSSTSGLVARTASPVPSPSHAIYSNTLPEDQPLNVQIPGQKMDYAERTLMKFSQLIMMLIALGAIWFGLVSIAFSGDTTTDDFLIIFLGGTFSAAIVIGWIELQSKKNNHVLYEVQDYMLGIAFFFATIGAIWGARWLIEIAAGEVSVFGNLTENEWQPNANGIYVQTAALVLVALVELQLLKRFKGATGFGRAVAAYAPIVTLIGAGIGPWMEWTNNEISYEFGISLIVLCFLSMELALRSNKSFNFVVVAVASGLTPILFELYNTNVEVGGEGGALSLLVFIIAIQGYYASREELRSELIQKASILLVGEVLFAIMYARADNLNLHLGPFKPHEIGLESYIGLSVALWIAVLVFYFPAVINRRVPWMPVGLAFALALLPNDGSTIPWAVTLVMIPYMLFISKATRRWVADLTVSALALAYFITDFYAGYLRETELPLSETFGFNGMHVLIPIALFIIAEFARRLDKISMSVHLIMLSSVILSRTILQAEEWFMPWIFIGYMLYLARDSFAGLTSESSYKEREQATLMTLVTFSAMIILVFLDQFQLPDALTNTPLPEYFNYQVFILGGLSYVSLYAYRTVELDLGLLFNSTNRLVKNTPTYNPETNAWVTSSNIGAPDQEWEKSHSWSQITRISLIIPFLMMTLSVVSISGIFDYGFNLNDDRLLAAVDVMIAEFWFCLIVIPVIGLVSEVQSMKVISSRTRAAGIWALFTVVVPLSLLFSAIRGYDSLSSEQETGIFTASVILDLIILSAPLYVNRLITKRGLDREAISKTADGWAMVGLLALACLDTSGGLLIVSMMILVTARSLQYNHVWPLMLSPLVYLVQSDAWLTNPGIMELLIETVDSSFARSLAEMEVPGFARLSGFLILVQMIAIWIIDTKLYNESRGKRELVPWPAITAWTFVGVVSVLSSLGWVPAIFMFGLIVHAWSTGRLESLLLMHFGFWISLMFGFVYSADPDTTLYEAISWSSLYTGSLAGAFLALNERNLLTRFVPNQFDADDATQLRISPEGISEIVSGLSIACYVFLTISFEALFGLGTMLGAFLLTRDLILRGQFTGLLFAPAVHGIALYNLFFQIGIPNFPISELVGLFLIAEGAFISWLSLKNDEVYDFEYFEWVDDNQFLDFIDRLGMSGITTLLGGLFILFGEWEQWQIAFLLTTIVLIVNGVQGYSTNYDSRWRRIVGGYGSIVSFLAFISELSDDIWRALSWMALGLIALGWGFLTMQRLEDDDKYDEMVDALQPELPTEIQPETPVVAEDETESRQEEEEKTAKPSEAPEETTAVEPAKPKHKPQYPSPAPVLPSITTEFDFEIQLPPGKLEAILRSIETTEHEGYKPIVGFSPNGQIVIDWVAL